MTDQTQKIHIFEQAELGKAPFQLINVFEGDSMHTFCAYCSHPLIGCYRIQSADNKTFIVGCDCVMKTGDAGLVNKLKDEIAEKRRIKLQNDFDWACGNYSLYTEALKEVKHPYKSDLTMLDYIEYIISKDHGLYCYDTSKKIIIKAVKEAKKSIGEKQERSLQNIQTEKQAMLDARSAEIKRQQEEENNKKIKFEEEWQKAYEKAQNLPHPNNFFAKRGKTLKDYIDYFLHISFRNERHPKVLEALETAGAKFND